MISLYMKNRPWNGHPRCDYVRVISEQPLQIKGYRIDRANKLEEEPVDPHYLGKYRGWYHPATAWEIEEYRRLGGALP
jgi:hypothetical protein